MNSLGGLLFPLLFLLVLIPMFLGSRKQRRQMQNMQQMQAALQPGDVVTTTSGLRGTVVDAQYEDTVDLEIADGVITTWLRAAVRDKVLDAGSPEPVDEAVPGSDGASLDDPVSPAATRPDPVRTDPVRPESVRPESVRTDSASEPVVDT